MCLIPFSHAMLHVALAARAEVERLGVAHITLEIYLKVIFEANGSLHAARFFKDKLRWGEFERKLETLINSHPKNSESKYVNCLSLERVVEEAAYLQLEYATQNHQTTFSEARVTVASFLWAASLTAAKDLFESSGLNLTYLTSREVLSYRQ
jgi:hypothetical protein